MCICLDLERDHTFISSNPGLHRLDPSPAAVDELLGFTIIIMNWDLRWRLQYLPLHHMF